MTTRADIDKPDPNAPILRVLREAAMQCSGLPEAESARTNFDLVAGQAACDSKLLRRILASSPHVSRTLGSTSASLQQLLDPESGGILAFTVPKPTYKLSALARCSTLCLS